MLLRKLDRNDLGLQRMNGFLQQLLRYSSKISANYVSIVFLGDGSLQRSCDKHLKVLT